jgi:hypothetical protein
VRRELVNVTRNGRQVVRVYQEPSKTVAPIEEAGPPKKAPDFINSIGMEFVLLPTARFWMGGGGGKAGGKGVVRRCVEGRVHGASASRRQLPLRPGL